MSAAPKVEQWMRDAAKEFLEETYAPIPFVVEKLAEIIASHCPQSAAPDVDQQKLRPNSLEENHAARTKLELKFWTAMYQAGIKSEWDAQEKISIDDLAQLMAGRASHCLQSAEGREPK